MENADAKQVLCHGIISVSQKDAMTQMFSFQINLDIALANPNSKESIMAYASQHAQTIKTRKE